MDGLREPRLRQRDHGWWLAAATLGMAAASGIQNDLGVQVIPRPRQVDAAPGHFVITAETRIAFNAAAAAPAAGMLRDWLGQTCGRELVVEEGNGPDAAGSIRMVLEAAAAAGAPGRREGMEGTEGTEGTGVGAAESYRLEITRTGVTLKAGAPAGLVAGSQTLRQLLPIQRIVGLPAELIEWRLPCGTIDDGPRFRWRGLMLDCSRTFQAADYLQRTIDRLAFYKLNVLHLHLTDDQGWRIEVGSRPELTGKGARFPERWGEPPEHQGFYPQARMRELVAYAAARNVTIVPEIELPGHCLAVLACYPQLSCTGGPFEIHPFGKGPGIHEDILCAGNDEVLAFVDQVLGEVCEVFPSEFVHVGGDEAPKARWKQCPKCQARMRGERLATEEELQGWFMKQVAVMLAKRGRKLIGWDEILDGGLAPGAAVMSWRGTKGGIAAATAGHPVVMSPTSHCYFDYPYQRIDTRRAFGFDPLAGLAGEATASVLGIQANFWSHLDREPAKVDAQVFPRLLAIAERGWSPAGAADWDDFAWRAKIHLVRLDELGVAWRRGPLAAPDQGTGDQN